MKKTLFSLLVFFSVLLLDGATRAALAEDYFITVVERPFSGRFNSDRKGTYKFEVKIHPSSPLPRIDGYGRLCVADSAKFAWDGTAPEIPPIQSRLEVKIVQGTIKALGTWVGDQNIFFSAALPGSQCASNGLNPPGQSNRVQETARVEGSTQPPSGQPGPEYQLDLLQRPASGRLDSQGRGIYRFSVRINPNSSVQRIDLSRMLCVGPSSLIDWSGAAPQVPPLLSRNDVKTIEGTVKAVVPWVGQRNASFSIAILSSVGCGTDGMNSNSLSNRVSETITAGLSSNPPAQPATGQSVTMPPYRLRVDPAAGADSETQITLRAEPTGTGASSGTTCKYEAINQRGAIAWSITRTDCSQAGATLSPGTYTLRLTLTGKGETPAAGAAVPQLVQTTERRDYVVRPALQFAVTSLVAEPAQVDTRQSVTARMKIKNLSAITVRDLRWRIKGGSASFSRKIDEIAPGQETEVTQSLGPFSGGPVEITGEADPDNQLNEATARRADNKRTINLPVDDSLPTPVIAGGAIRYLGPKFEIGISFCNLTLDRTTSYRFISCDDGPQCHRPNYSNHKLAYAFSTYGDLDPLTFRKSQDSNASPSCPSSGRVRNALSVTMEGARPACGSSVTHKIEIEATRGDRIVRSQGFYFTVSAVAPDCGPTLPNKP